MPTRKTPVPKSPPAAAAAAPAPAAVAKSRKTARAAKPEPAKVAEAAKKSAKPGKPPKLPKPPKPVKARPQLVRDGFTMPEGDFALLAELKSRAISARRETKKSELLRAGLRALAALDAAQLIAALDALEPIKVGRPKKGH